MGVFYHVFGLLLMNVGNSVMASFVPEYDPSGIPISVASSLAAGPIEEIIFFGMPYLIFSNPIVLFGFGLIWALLHLFNSQMIDFSTLSYGGFLFAFVHIFFSIRTWISGKGWLAIAFHSFWNLSVLLSLCSFDLIPCNIFSPDENYVKDILLVLISICCSVLIYFSYMRKQNKKFPNAYYVMALCALVVATIPLVILNLDSIFNT